MSKEILIKIPIDIVSASFKDALSQPIHRRGNFFHEIRRAFKKQVEAKFRKSGLNVYPDIEIAKRKNSDETLVEKDRIIKYTGWNKDKRIELDTAFCARYGHDDSTVRSINYTDRALYAIPSLYPFCHSDYFSIGNILIVVESDDYSVNIEFAEGINATGYSCSISKKKRKSYVCLFGIWFGKEILKPIIEGFDSKPYEIDAELDEIQLGFISYPTIFINRRNADLYICSCFEGHFNLDNDIVKKLPHGNSEPELEERVRKITIRDNICHLCTKTIPKIDYGHEMYYNLFVQKFLPYQTLFLRQNNMSDLAEGTVAKKIEEQLRKTFGIPEIKKKNVSEALLYKIIDRLFFDKEVIFHYRGEELDGLELDIWIPELKVGIEYQGKQHYDVVKPWGGKQGLQMRKENDKKKKGICKKLGYQLIEFKYTENLTEENIRKKLEKYFI